MMLDVNLDVGSGWTIARVKNGDRVIMIVDFFWTLLLRCRVPFEIILILSLTCLLSIKMFIPPAVFFSVTVLRLWGCPAP